MTTTTTREDVPDGTAWTRVERADGTRTRMLLRRPSTTPRAGVLCFPAMGVTARYYAPLLDELAARGFVAASVDLRGHGECNVRPARGVDYGYEELVRYDYPAAVDAMRRELGALPLVLLGHSLGGQLACLYLASAPPIHVHGLVLVASCSNDYRGWPVKLRAPVWAGTQLAGVIARVLGYFPGRRLQFAGTEAQRLICDWARQARTGTYEPSGASHDYEQALRSLRIPVLAISFANDLFAPAAAVDLLVKKLAQATVARLDLGPEPGLQLDHFRWVKSVAPVVDRVDPWLRTLGL